MEKHRKIRILVILACIAVFLVPSALPRRYDTLFIGYDRWAAEDYVYEYSGVWERELSDEISARDEKYIEETGRVIEFSEGGTLDPLGAITGAIGWVADSIGSIFGKPPPQPYEAD